MRKALERRLGVVFGLALALLFVIGAVQGKTILGLVDAAHRVAHTSETLEELATAQSLLSDAQAATRNYVITSEESSLDPYRTAVLRIPLVLSSLRKSTADDPNQQRKVDALAAMAATHLADLRRLVEARSRDDSSGVRQLMGAASQKAAEDDARQAIRGMEDEERRLLARRNVAEGVTAWEATLTSTAGSALALWLLVLAGLLVHYYVNERRRIKVDQALSMQLLKSLTEGVYLFDESGTIIYTNPAGEALLGYKPGELVGTSIALAEENAHWFDQIREQLKMGGTWKGELASRKEDGTPLTCYALISALEICGKEYWVSVQGDIKELQPPGPRPAPSGRGIEIALEGVEAR